jgi:hypothetical protein
MISKQNSKGAINRGIKLDILAVFKIAFVDYIPGNIRIIGNTIYI